MQSDRFIVDRHYKLKFFNGQMRVEISELPSRIGWVCFLGEPEMDIDVETEITAGVASAHNIPRVLFYTWCFLHHFSLNLVSI